MKKYIFLKSFIVPCIILIILIGTINAQDCIKQKNNQCLENNINTISIFYDKSFTLSNNDEFTSFSNTNSDELDQSNTNTVGAGLGCMYPDTQILFAQSFHPTLSTLTRISLFMFKTGHPSSDNELTLSIRKSLDGSDLVTITINQDDVSPTGNWPIFDFPDLKVNVYEEYFMILRATAGNSGQNNACYWLFGTNNPYKNGNAYLNDGTTWILFDLPDIMPSADFCFKTYGINGVPDAPDIQGPTQTRVRSKTTYEITGNDPDLHDLYYWVEWGDGTTGIEDVSGWVGPYHSGDTISFEHKWTKKGEYTIRLRSKDIKEEISEWTELTIELPKYKQPSFIKNLLSFFFSLYI